MDDDVFESLLFPFVANVFGEFVVALRSGDVRFGGEDAVLAAFEGLGTSILPTKTALG